MSLSSSQMKALAIAPKVTGPLSMIGSALIIKATIGEVIRERDTTYHRIMLGLSVVDFWSSLALAFSTLPIPEGSPAAWGAKGNTVTCTFQGFFIQQASTVSIYSGTLSVYYLLYSRYRWKEERLRSVENYFHLIPAVVGLGFGIAGLPLELYNNAVLWCWIAPYPLGCKDSYRFGSEATCTRGDNWWIYRYAFSYVPLWISIIVSTGCMILVYDSVRQQEKTVDVCRSDGLAIREKSKRVATQAFYYLLAFYVTWLPGTIVTVLHQVAPATAAVVDYPFVFALAALMPLQGFFNAIVFFRARFLKYLREHPNPSVINYLFGTTSFTSDGTTSLSRSGEQQTIEIGTPECARKMPNVVDGSQS